MDLLEADRALIHERALDRALEEAVSLLQADPGRLQAWLQQSAAVRNLPRTLAAGMVLREHGIALGKRAVALAEALVAAGRPEEALEVLREADGANPHVLNLSASALAACGRFAEAREAARGAAAGGIKRKARIELRDSVLEAIGEAEARLGDGDAAAWRTFLEGCLAVNARKTAAARAVGLAGQLEALERADRTDRAALLTAAVRAGAAEAMAPVIRRLLGTAPDDEGLLAALVEAELHRGRPAEAVHALRCGPAAPRKPVLRAAAAAAKLAAGREDEGIAELSALSRNAKDHELQRQLARAVGRRVLASSDLRYRAEPGRPRVFNILPFSNELHLLKLRLEEMSPWVDHFVVVEAAKTFTGLDKPLEFDRAKAQFAAHLPKILHVRLDDFPAWLPAPWGRDYYQRDMALGALGGLLAPDDVVLITDADEIIRREALDRFDGSLMGLIATNHRYFLNYTNYHGARPAPHRTGAICRGWMLHVFGASYLRFYLSWAFKHWNEMASAGWHFTSVNSAAKIAAKFNSFAHTEVIKFGVGDEARIADRLAEIRAGSFEPGWRRQELDDSFPAYVLNNRDALAELIL